MANQTQFIPLKMVNIMAQMKYILMELYRFLKIIAMVKCMENFWSSQKMA